MGALDDRELIHPETRGRWRAWLAAHNATSPGVWLVTWKKATGRPRLEYDEAVEEALCVGWIDSQARTLDDERSRQLYTPRRSGSTWSRPNKERVARMTAAGLMTPAGLAVVAAAKADGSWSLLDDVEDLIEPDELRAALDARPAARAGWDRFPPSARKAMLWWVVEARRPETRARRIAEIVAGAAEGVRARG